MDYATVTAVQWFVFGAFCSHEKATDISQACHKILLNIFSCFVVDYSVQNHVFHKKTYCTVASQRLYVNVKHNQSDWIFLVKATDDTYSS